MSYLRENISLAIAGLQASKMRALLTMLGIIIGIGSVIAISTIGDALTGTMTDSMSSMGVNNITVSLQERNSQIQGPGNIGGTVASIKEKDLITSEMINTFSNLYSNDIRAISYVESLGSGKVQDDHLYANVSISGVNEEYQTTSNVELIEGRFLTERDVLGRKNVAVVSDRVAKSLFGGNTASIDQEIKVYTEDRILTFSVVGVYKYNDNGMGGFAATEDVSTGLYIPVTTAKKLSGGSDGYQSFTITTTPEADSAQIVTRIETFFERYYASNIKYTVYATSMESMLDTMTTILSNVQLAIAAIAAISLVVGGIGVMNIMLVSVTERTREIGTRKALGARDSAIRIQFVVEAIIICMIGGVIGIILGILLGAVAASLLGAAVTVSLSSISLAVGFSMMIGIFFGYYPANKAAKMDPIDALRYE